MTLWSADQDGVETFAGQGAVPLAWSLDGKILASGEQDASVHFRILSTRQNLLMSGYPTSRCRARTEDGSRAATWPRRGAAVVTVWDCSGKGPEGKKPCSSRDYEELVRVLAFQRTGPLLASGGSDGNRVVAARQVQVVPEQVGPGLRSDPGAWGPDDLTLAAGSAAGKVVVYGVS